MKHDGSETSPTRRAFDKHRPVTTFRSRTHFAAVGASVARGPSVPGPTLDATSRLQLTNAAEFSSVAGDTSSLLEPQQSWRSWSRVYRSRGTAFAYSAIGHRPSGHFEFAVRMHP